LGNWGRGRFAWAPTNDVLDGRMGANGQIRLNGSCSATMWAVRVVTAATFCHVFSPLSRYLHFFIPAFRSRHICASREMASHAVWVTSRAAIDLIFDAFGHDSNLGRYSESTWTSDVAHSSDITERYASARTAWQPTKVVGTCERSRVRRVNAQSWHALRQAANTRRTNRFI